mgnify:CR=1 FL=1
MESTLIFPFAEVAADLRRLVQVHILPDHDEEQNADAAQDDDIYFSLHRDSREQLVVRFS